MTTADALTWATTHPLYAYGALIAIVAVLAALKGPAPRVAWHLSLPLRLIIAAAIIVGMVLLVQRWRRADAAKLGRMPTWRETAARAWNA